MSNFFLKIRKLESKLWKSFLLCGTSSSSSLHLGRIIRMMILSSLRVSKCTTSKPSNAHQHCSVKRVMFFNGISPSWAGVKYSAGSTYFQGWKTKQRMAESEPEHVLDFVGAVCCLWVGIFLLGGAHNQWFWVSSSQTKNKIGKILFSLSFLVIPPGPNQPSVFLSWAFVHLSCVYAVKDDQGWSWNLQ